MIESVALSVGIIIMFLLFFTVLLLLCLGKLQQIYVEVVKIRRGEKSDFEYLPRNKS